MTTWSNQTWRAFTSAVGQICLRAGKFAREFTLAGTFFLSTGKNYHTSKSVKVTIEGCTANAKKYFLLMNIIIWMLWRFVFLNYKNCVEEHFLVPSALTLALYLIIKCIIMSTQWLRQVQLTKILHTIIIILTAFHSCALVSQFIFVNITRSTVFYFYFYLFAGSGSGGPSNEEFCAKDQEHTMCKYPVRFIVKKTG